MLKKSKKFLLLILKKKNIFFVLIFILLGTFLFNQSVLAERFTPPDAGQIPAESGGASWWQSIKNLYITLPSVLIGLVFYTAAQISSIIAATSAVFLRWVLSDSFINISYTNPGDNPIVKAGLDVTQSFVNMILVLVLVYIALATILRLAGYETKKLLTTFIIVALLVNFAPVICGVIVDASNITMNLFFQNTESIGTNFINKAKEPLDMAKNIWADIANPAITIASAAEGLAKLAVMTIVYLLAAFVYFIFAFIFAARYLMIWLLVILSPIAFACYILPITKKFWDQWWNQFIQWCIIGITCGFFLYLGEHFTRLFADNQIKLSINEPTLMAAILPLLIPIIFLIIGLIWGLQTSAMGASTVMSFRKATAKWAGRQTAGRFLASERGRKIMAGAAKTRFRIARPSEIKGKGPAKWAKQGLAGALSTAAAPFYWATRAAGTAGLTYGAAQEKRFKAEQEKLKEKFGEDYERAAPTYTTILPDNYHKKIAMGRYLSETKGAKGLEQLTEDQLREVVKLTARYNPEQLKDLIKYKPELINDAKVGDILKQKVAKTPSELVEKMEPKDYKNISKNALKDVAIVDTMINKAMGSHISNLIEEHGKDASDAIEKQIKSQATKASRHLPPGAKAITPEEYLKKANPRLHKYLTQGTGQGLVDLSP